MSEQFEGFVKVTNRKADTNNRGPWFKVSFKLEAADGQELEPWFGWEFNKELPFQKGDYVRFEGKPSAYGVDVTPNTGSKVANAPTRSGSAPSKANPAASGGGGGGSTGTRDGYWEQKGKHEIENIEPRIRYTAARRLALDFMEFLASHAALPVSESKGKAGTAKREEELVACLNKYTIEFYFDTQTLRLIDTVEDAGTVAVPPSQPDVDVAEVAEPTPETQGGNDIAEPDTAQESFDDDIPF
jgi:hypothetical protein